MRPAGWHEINGCLYLQWLERRGRKAVMNLPGFAGEDAGTGADGIIFDDLSLTPQKAYMRKRTSGSCEARGVPVYTEDGFELKVVGDTMELSGSGEVFHEDSPPIFRAFSMLADYSDTRKVLCDLRMIVYILEPAEMAARAAIVAQILHPYLTAIVGRECQRPLLTHVVESLRTAGGEAKLFSSREAARDWLCEGASRLPDHQEQSRGGVADRFSVAGTIGRI